MKLPLTKYYDGIEYEIAKIVQRVLLFFVIPTLALSVTLFYMGDQLRATLMLILIIFIFLMVALLHKGLLRLTVVTFSIAVNLMVTWSCINGNGIHDIAIVIYPVTILFSTIILRKGDLWFVSLLSAGCISVLVLGEKYEYYIPTNSGGDGTDVLIIVFLLASGFVTTATLSKKINLSLSIANNEIKRQQEMKEVLEDNLESKSDILRQVHHRVKNHLSFINSVIDIQALEDEYLAQRKPDLQNRVMAVARAHDQLYHTDNYKQVRAKDYLEQVIGAFTLANGLIELKVDMQIEDEILAVDQALNLALLVNELLLVVRKHYDSIVRLEFILSITEERQFCLIVLKKRAASWTLEHNAIASINLLSNKFNADFEFLDGLDKSIFEINF